MNEEEYWVHCLTTYRYAEGEVIGWMDEKSPTGYLSGIVVRVDHTGLRVLVRDIRPGIISRPFAGVR